MNVTMVVSVVITDSQQLVASCCPGCQQVLTRCHQGHLQVITRSCQCHPQVFTGHHKNYHMVVNGHQMRKNVRNVLTCHNSSSVYLTKNFHMAKLPVLWVDIVGIQHHFLRVTLKTANEVINSLSERRLRGR